MKDFNKKYLLFGAIIILAVGLGMALLLPHNAKSPENQIAIVEPSPTPVEIETPDSKVLENGGYHIFQTFNNCGPAALSMALSFYNVNISQADLGQALRPYQVAGGFDDDKSVTLEELAEKSKEYGFIPYHRPMGNPDLVIKFIANDMPVITRTWTYPNEDIGHYRVIKGYDKTKEIFIQDDSLQNKNLAYSYADFNAIWNKFNYEYLVLVPKDKIDLANSILGKSQDPKIAWQDAADYSSRKLLEQNSLDVTAGFNLSVALANLERYEESIIEFEKVENKLSARTLWYQIEPIKAYYEVGDYERVFSISQRILNNQNRAFSELYILRGKSYLAQEQTELARAEFEKAVLYNKNLLEAQSLLSST